MMQIFFFEMIKFDVLQMFIENNCIWVVDIYIQGQSSSRCQTLRLDLFFWSYLDDLILFYLLNVFHSDLWYAWVSHGSSLDPEVSEYTEVRGQF